MAGDKRPCYFVVALDPVGREQPMLYWDKLPRAMIRHLVYRLRLDQLPHGEQFTQASLAELFNRYQRLKALGQLPPYEP